jgi:hypothetical protein
MGDSLMQSVKGTYRNGIIQLDEPVSAEEGQPVIITFVEFIDQPEQSSEDSSWDDLMDFIEENAIETGIPDLAHQHDHYLHGTPKREP